jgi:hypothetical protein
MGKWTVYLPAQFPLSLFDLARAALESAQVNLTLTANATFILYNFTDVGNPGFPQTPFPKRAKHFSLSTSASAHPA